MHTYIPIICAYMSTYMFMYVYICISADMCRYMQICAYRYAFISNIIYKCCSIHLYTPMQQWQQWGHNIAGTSSHNWSLNSTPLKNVLLAIFSHLCAPHFFQHLYYTWKTHTCTHVCIYTYICIYKHIYIYVTIYVSSYLQLCHSIHFA